MATRLPTVVLIPGAWHGPWAWDEVRQRLDIAGIPSAAVSLPSVGGPGGLTDDVAAVAATVDEVGGPVVLVGHSYGGLPATEIAATRPDVLHTVYVCAFVLPAGVSLLEAAGGQPPALWNIAEDDLTMMPNDPDAKLFSQCEPGVAADAVARLRPQSTRSVREPLAHTAYGHIPATYVVGEKDAEFPAAAQRGMAEAAMAAVVSLDSDHSPMLSRPGELALVLAGIVARAAL